MDRQEGGGGWWCGVVLIKFPDSVYTIWQHVWLLCTTILPDRPSFFLRRNHPRLSTHHPFLLSSIPFLCFSPLFTSESLSFLALCYHPPSHFPPSPISSSQSSHTRQNQHSRHIAIKTHFNNNQNPKSSKPKAPPPKRLASRRKQSPIPRR